MDRKKFFLIVGIIIVILLIIAGIAYLIYSKTTQTSGKSTISLVENLDEKVFSPSYLQSQNAVYYFNQGILAKFSFNDKKTTILYPDKTPYLQKTKFNPDGSRALILVREGENYIYRSIDFNSNEVIPLVKNIADADWLSNEQIIYSYSNAENGEYYLNTADFKGSNAKKIADLGFSDALVIPSPDQSKIIIYPEPEGYGDNFLTMYNFTTQKFTKFETKGLVGAVWSPDGQKIISDIYNEQGEITSTVILNVSDQKTKNIDLQYQISKITWLDNENIVALKNEGENISDQFYLVSAKNGKSKKINIEKSTNLFLDVQYLTAQNDKTILFTTNDFLYQLDLIK